MTPEDDLRLRAEEGHRAREPSGDPEADAGPGALEAVHHVSDVEAALSKSVSHFGDRKG